MAVSWVWTGYSGVVSTLLSGEISTIVSGGVVFSSAINNASARNCYATFEFTANWSAAPGWFDATFLLLRSISIDGTNYATIPSAFNHQFPHAGYIGTFGMRRVNSSQVCVMPEVTLTPGLQRFVLANWSDRGLSATGNSLRHNPYDFKNGSGAVVRWTSYAGVISVFTTQLTNIGNAVLTSSALDNRTTRYQYADFELFFQYSTAPTDWCGRVFLAFLVSEDNGATYPSSPALNTTGAWYFDTWLAQTSAQRLALAHVPLPPALYKIHLEHSSHRDAAAAPSFTSAGGHLLRFNPYSLEMAE